MSPAALKLSSAAATQNVRSPRNDILDLELTRRSVLHNLLWRPVYEEQSPVLFGAIRIIGITFPRFIESLKEKHGHVSRFGPVPKLVVITSLLGFTGSLAKFRRRCCPTSFKDRHGLAGERGPHSLQVLQCI